MRSISVRELSFALAHRWEPERLFMFVYTGYFDESGTHDDSPVTVMGGLLAKADQWSRFEKKFAAAQKHHGFEVWHTKKFKHKNGDFKGWTDDQCQALYWDLAKLTGYDLTDTVTMALSNKDYDKFYRSGDAPRKARFDTKYGLCFRACLHYFAAEVFKRKHRNRVPPLHIVLEAGHVNYGDAERVFLDVKHKLEKLNCPILRTITKAEKDSCGQLMMADFAAHSEFLMNTKARIDRGEPYPSTLKPERIPKGMTHMAHLASTEQQLKKLRAEVIEKAMPKKAIAASASGAGQSS